MFNKADVISAAEVKPSFISTDVRKYKIRFYGYARPYVKDKIRADDRTITGYAEEGFAEIIFSSSQDYVIMEWVLVQGVNAEPVSPVYFVKERKNHIQWMTEPAASMPLLKLTKNRYCLEPRTSLSDMYELASVYSC